MSPYELPSGYVLRRPVREDLPEVLALMQAVDLADVGEVDTSEEDVLDVWNMPRFALERDAWVIEGPGKRLVAYGWAWDKKPHVEIQADSYVLPDLEAAGLEEPILDRLEERAEEHRSAAPRSEEVKIRLFTSPKAQSRIAWLLRRGYAHIRTYARMTISLEAPPPEPQWPEGIEARPFRTGEDERRIEETIQESFADHFGFAHEPHEEWVQRHLSHPSFDPDLWILAWDGAQVAGAVINYPFEKDGWVRELGVRPAWRGRGLGRALLLQSFRLFHARGMREVGLGVDVANATGATQLYESAGMRVAFQHDLYERSLGPGRSA